VKAISSAIVSRGLLPVAFDGGRARRLKSSWAFRLRVGLGLGRLYSCEKGVEFLGLLGDPEACPHIPTVAGISGNVPENYRMVSHLAAHNLSRPNGYFPFAAALRDAVNDFVGLRLGDLIIRLKIFGVRKNLHLVLTFLRLVWCQFNFHCPHSIVSAYLLQVENQTLFVTANRPK